LKKKEAAAYNHAIMAKSATFKKNELGEARHFGGSK
jgi:hypothetical protein